MTSLNNLLHLPVPLILASRSPRRRLLLKHVGFEFSTVEPLVDEESIEPKAPFDLYVQTLAGMKAEAGLRMVSGDAIVIGSDTAVALGVDVLNKPQDAADAKRMLSMLSGRTHIVHTGLALHARVHGKQSTYVTASATEVTFRVLQDAEIEAYIAGGSPMDKAGAYGIQDDYGAVFVRAIHGCYFTVVGLPLELLYTSLQQLVSEL